MSIASRIEAIEEHIGNVYNTIDLAKDTTGTNKNIVNIPSKLKDAYVDIINNGTNTLYNNFPKQTGTGETLSLTPTYQAPMKVDLKGNTSQVQLSGKNLFGGFTFTKTNNGITFNYYKDGSISASGTSTGNALSMSSSEARDNDYLITLQTGTYTISGGNSNIRVEVVNNTGSSIARTGASGYTTFTINSETQVFVRLNIESGKTINETIYQMLEQGSTPTTYEVYCGGIPSPNPDYPQPVQVVSGSNTITITDEDNTETQTFSINLPSGMELCKIGDYQDSFVYDNNKWYKRANVGKVVINGSESNWSSETAYTGYYRYSCSGILPAFTRGNNGLNNRFTQRINQPHGDYQYLYMQENNGHFHIQILQSRLTDGNVSTFKTWLSNNNVDTYYILNEQTDTEITNTTLINQLNAIKEATSYNGTTNILQTNNDLPFIITASALKKE